MSVKQIVKNVRGSKFWKRVAAMTMVLIMLATLLPASLRFASAADSDKTKLVNYIYEAGVTGEDLVVNGNTWSNIIPGQLYEFTLSFKEGDLQFVDDDTVMTYTLPSEVVGVAKDDGLIDIIVNNGSETYTVHDNPFTVSSDGKTISFRFNDADEQFYKLKETGNTRFELRFFATFNCTGDNIPIDFGNNVVKTASVNASHHASVSKNAWYDATNKKIHYTVTVSSQGISENINVKDVISGEALTLDESSIAISNGTFASGPSTTAKGFDAVIASVGNNQSATITYTASVDTSMVGSDGKITGTGNDVSITCEDDSDSTKNHTAHSEQNIVGTSISKSSAVGGTDGDVITWTITVNPERNIAMAGKAITDTLGDYQTLLGSGITIEATGTDNVTQTSTKTWAELGTAEGNSDSWSYTPTDTDPKQYVITYQTKVDKSTFMEDKNVTNNVSYPYGSAVGNATIGVGVDDTYAVSKNYTYVDMENKEITWQIAVNVPKTGYTSDFKIQDSFPNAWVQIGSNWTQVIEGLASGSTINVEGLADGESYTTDITDTGVTLTFYEDAEKTNPGLQATGTARKIYVTLKTRIDENWLETAKTSTWMAGHTNTANVTANGNPKSSSSTAIPVEVVFTKTGSKAGENTDAAGNVYPYYRYEILMTGVDSDTITLKDTLPTGMKFFNENNSPAGYVLWDHAKVYGGDQYSQSNEGAANSVVCNSDGTINVTVPKTSGGTYYGYYKLIYYTIVKDADALSDLTIQALAEEDHELTLTNSITFNGARASSDVTFTPNSGEILQKELLNSSELKADNHFAKYQIKINPNALTMNGGKDMEFKDTFTNLSIDYSSITFTPADKVTVYNVSGNTLTATIPDATAITLTYTAKVIGNTWVTFENEASMEGFAVTSSERKNFSSGSSGGGTSSIPSIQIFKHELGNMKIPLEGAEFELYTYTQTDEDGVPTDGKAVRDNKNRIVTVTTGEDGYATIKGTMSNDGWTLKDDGTKYYLEEVEAPEGYELDDTLYKFSISSTGVPDYLNYIYYDGDTMRINNKKEEQESGELIITKTLAGDVPSGLDLSQITFSVIDGDGKKYDSKTLAEIKAGYDAADSAYDYNSSTKTYTWKLTDVPGGTYIVTEEISDTSTTYTIATTYKVTGETTYTLYQSDSDVPQVDIGSETQTVDFKNTYTLKQDGSITVSKAFKSANSVTKTFYFALFKDAEGTVRYDTTPGGVVSITTTGDRSGVSTKSITFSGLPHDTYYVFETDKNGNKISGAADFKITEGADGKMVTISADHTQETVDFVNEELVGTVKVTKTIAGELPDASDYRSIKITVTDVNGKEYTKTLAQIANLVTFPEATQSATVSGQTYTWTITGVPVGKCVVTESAYNVNGFSVVSTYTVNASDTPVAYDDSAVASTPSVTVGDGTTETVELTNTYSRIPGSLVVTKQITSDDPTKTWDALKNKIAFLVYEHGTDYTVGTTTPRYTLDYTTTDAGVTYSQVDGKVQWIINGVPSNKQYDIYEKVTVDTSDAPYTRTTTYVVDSGSKTTAMKESGSTADTEYYRATSGLISADGNSTVAFTNDYKVKRGPLVIKKVLSGDDLPKNVEDIELKVQNSLGAVVDTVTLETLRTNTSDYIKVLTGTYAGVRERFVYNASTKEYTWTFTNLPIGTYIVTESGYEFENYTNSSSFVIGEGSAESYTGASTPNVPVVEVTGGTITLTNVYTRKPGNLVITKTITGGPNWDVIKNTVMFKIEHITGRTVLGITGKELVKTIKDGAAVAGVENVTFSVDPISGLASYTMTGLKAGEEYMVTEIITDPVTGEASYYTRTTTASNGTEVTDTEIHMDSVTVVASDSGKPDAKTDFVNNYTSKLGRLDITKTVTGTVPAEAADDTFIFNLTLKDRSNHAVDGTYTVSGVTDSTITFAGGQAELRIKASETATITGIPYGYSCTIEEKKSTEGYAYLATGLLPTSEKVDTHYSYESGEGTVVIREGEVNSAEITNTYHQLGSLKITKKIELKDSPAGTLIPNDMDFTIHITLKNSAGTPVTGSYPIIYYETEGVTREERIAFTSGEAVITLRKDWTAEIREIEPGSQYIVTEDTYTFDEHDGYNNTDNNIDYHETTGTHTIGREETKKVDVNNWYRERPQAITIKKTVSYATDYIGLDKTDIPDATFVIEVTLTKADGTPLPDAQYGSTYIKDGKGIITIKNGELAALTNVPAGTHYTITETKMQDEDGNLVDIPDSASFGFVKSDNGNNVYVDGAATGTVTASGVTQSTTTAIEVKNEYVPSKVYIQKRGINQDAAGVLVAENLAGATLQILDADTGALIKEWVSSNAPKEIIGLVADGRHQYVLRETKAPDGFMKADDVAFVVSTSNQIKLVTPDAVKEFAAVDGTYQPTATSANTASLLKLTDVQSRFMVAKVDENGDLLGSAKMQIRKVDSSTVERSLASKEDSAVIIDGLADGEYILEEIETPTDYRKAEPITFVVSGNTIELTAEARLKGAGLLKNTSGSETIYTIVMKDRKKIKISKVEVGGSDEVKGAQIQILKEDGITEVASWTSGTTAHVVDEYLEPGIYILREKVAPAGYTLATDTKFRIMDDGRIDNSSIPDEERVVTASEDKDLFLIEDTMTSISINKADITGDQPLKGAILQILEADTNKVVKLTVDGNTAKVSEEGREFWISSGSVPMQISGLSVGKEYKLIETVAPDGYTIATETRFVLDNEGKPHAAADNENQDTDIDVENSRILVKDSLTQVSISKVDINSGEELDDAVLYLLDENNAPVLLDASGRVVKEGGNARWTSSKLTPKVITGLTTNKKYTLVEETAPRGYDITTANTTFVLDKNGKVDQSDSRTTVYVDDHEVNKILIKDYEEAKAYLTITKKVTSDDPERTWEAIKNQVAFLVYENGSGIEPGTTTPLYVLTAAAPYGDGITYSEAGGKAQWTIDYINPNKQYVVYERLTAAASDVIYNRTVTCAIKNGTAQVLMMDPVSDATASYYGIVSGEIAENETITMDFTNDYRIRRGNLVVTKKLTGDDLPKNVENITLKVTNSAEGTVDTITLSALREKANSGEIKKLHGAHEGAEEQYTYDAAEKAYIWTIKDLPLGTYVVSESNYEYENYTVATTYVIGEGTETAYSEISLPGVSLTEASDNKIALTNAYTRKLGNLVITKTVAGELDWDTVKDGIIFKIERITGRTVFGITSTEEVARIKDGVPVTGVDSVVFEKDANGVASYILTGLKAGEEYQVTEIILSPTGEAAYFTRTTTTSDYTEVTDTEVTLDDVKVVAADSGLAAAKSEFTNTYKTKTGQLDITKIVTAASGTVPESAADDMFVFELELKDRSGNGVDGTFNVSGVTDSTITFAGGKAQLRIKASETASITGIPYGYTYTVTEKRTTEDYAYLATGLLPESVKVDSHYSYIDGEVTVAKALKEGEANTVEIKNVYRELGTLQIKKIVNLVPEATPGTLIPNNKDFEITVSLKDAANQNVNGTYPITYQEFEETSEGINIVRTIKSEEVIFTDGKAVINLRKNWLASISELEPGYKYDITEKTYDFADESDNEIGYKNDTITYVETDHTIQREHISEVTVSNLYREKPQAITIRKTVSYPAEYAAFGLNKEDIPDVTFVVEVTLRKADGTPVADAQYGSVKITDGSGMIRIQNGETASVTNVPAGTSYTIQELGILDSNGTVISIPDTASFGFIKAADGANVYINGGASGAKIASGITSETPVKAEVKNEYVPSRVYIQKTGLFKDGTVDAENLNGVTLQILDADTGNVIKEWITGSAPEEIIGLIADGTHQYVLHEKEPVDGYLPIDDVAFVVSVDDKIVLKDAAAGSYASVNDSYKKTAESEERSLLKLTNTQNRFKVRKISEDGSRLAQAELRIRKEGSTDGIRWTTDAASDRVVNGLADGTYILEETKAPDDYRRAEAIRFTVEGNTITLDAQSKLKGAALAKDEEGNYVIVMTDRKKIKISKVEAGGDGSEIPGAQIEILLVDENGVETKIDAWESQNEAHVVEKDLVPGVYILRETVAPEGYLVTTDTKFVIKNNGFIDNSTIPEEERVVSKAGERNVFLVEDTRTSVSINKVDITGDQPLEGAYLQILDESGTPVRIDSDGNVVKTGGEEGWKSSGSTAKQITGLTTGKVYKLVEIVAPDGYAIATETLFTLDQNGKVRAAVGNKNSNTGFDTTNNTVLVRDTLTKVLISKVDINSEEELDGAVLQIKDENGDFVHFDENGNVVKEGGLTEWISSKEKPMQITGLTTGKKYTLVEKVAPEGYNITTTNTTFVLDRNGKVDKKSNSETTVYVGDEKTNLILVKDTRKDHTIKVSKVAAGAGKELPGAQIELYKNGKLVEAWVSTTEAHEVKNLYAGTYTLRETVAPAGYAITTDTSFVLKENGDIDTTGIPEGERAKTATKNGETVLLVEDDLTRVSINKVDITGDQPLAGAHLRLLDEDGNEVHIDENGSVIETGGVTEWISSGDKPKQITGLRTGVKYTLEETVAPDGYTIATKTTFVLDESGKVDTSKSTVSISEDDIILVKDSVTSLNFEKYGKYNESCIANPDSPDAVKPLSGVTFTATQIRDEAGNVVAGTAIEAKSNANGVVYFEKLAKGTYEIREMSTIGDYILDNTVYYAKVTDDAFAGLTTDIEGTKLVENNRLINDQYRADISFTKVSELDQAKKLEGSTYGLYTVKNGIITQVATAVTDKDGLISFDGVLINTEYIIQELLSPEGYYVSKEPITLGFTLDEDNQVVFDTTVFKSGGGTVFMSADGTLTWLEPEVIVSFAKTDEKSNLLAGATLQVIDASGKVVVDSWTSGTEARNISGVFVVGQTYRLVELAAPEGYELADPITFTIDDSSVGNGENKVITVTMVDKEKTVIVDTPKSAPKTGDTAKVQLAILLAMISLFGLLVIIDRKLFSKKA